MSIADDRDALAGKVAATGVRVTLDPGTVNPPCVYVGAPDLIAAGTVCAFDVTIPVHVIVPAPLRNDGIVWMLDTVPIVLAALDQSDATYQLYDPGFGPVEALPSYLITVAVMSEP